MISITGASSKSENARPLSLLRGVRRPPKVLSSKQLPGFTPRGSRISKLQSAPLACPGHPHGKKVSLKANVLRVGGGRGDYSISNVVSGMRMQVRAVQRSFVNINMKHELRSSRWPAGLLSSYMDVLYGIPCSTQLHYDVFLKGARRPLLRILPQIKGALLDRCFTVFGSPVSSEVYCFCGKLP